MLVSVVVPTRDRRPALERALASVDAQSHRDLELLVVDDGSTDDTAAWLARERPSVRVLAGGGCGAGGARNRGLAAARGELVAFLDDDDRWRPSYLEAQVELLSARPEIDLAYTDHVEFDAAGRESHPDLRPLAAYASELLCLLAEGGIHTMSAVVCRRAAVARWGGFDESLRVVQDLEWYARLVAGGARFARLPRALVERGVPGGLVSAYADWRREERLVHSRMLAAADVPRAQRRRVRAARALLFGRIGLANGDVRFGAASLAEALAAAPLWTVRLAVRRLARNRRLGGRRRAAQAWRVPAGGAG